MRIAMSWCVGLTASLVLIGTVSGQTTFELGFEGPKKIIGPKGGSGSASYECTLTHSGTGAGAQGWSMIMEAEGAVFTGIRIDGTDAGDNLDPNVIIIPQPPPLPPIEIPCNFVVTQISPGGTLACSAVVLSLCQPTTLPPNDTSSIAIVDVEADIPERGNAAASLRYVDSSDCFLGAADTTIITQGGQSFVPRLRGDRYQDSQAGRRRR